MSISMRHRRFISGPMLALIIGCGVGAILPANAIVTRHDTGYSRFLARESDYPAVFPLHVDQRRKTCVATLISARWALTAAHCATQTPLLAVLEAGERYHVTIAGQEFTADQLVFHPAWSTTADRVFDPQQIDLALFRLTTDVTHIPSLALYAGNDELGQTMTFLGWGYSGIGRTGISVNDGRLRFARNAVSQADRQLYFQFNDPSGPASVAVAFEGIPGLGDSGGPALLSAAGESWLAGIAVGELVPGGLTALPSTSGGRYGATVVYERISHHIAWIRQVMEADSAAVK